MVGTFLENIGRLFFVINPLVLIPIFYGFGINIKKYGDCLFRAIVTSLLVLIIFAIFGTQILKAIGISTYSFSIAGGVLLLIIGIRMMLTLEPVTHSKETNTRSKKTDVYPKETDTNEKLCVVPMGIPLIAGPGAITAVMLMAQNDTYKVYIIPIFTSLVIATALFISLIILYYSPSIIKYLEKHIGKNQTQSLMSALSAIMGIVVSAIGVEFIVSGISGFIPSLFG